MDNESRHRVVGVRPRKSSQSRRRSASKVVTESSAFGLESRHRVVGVRPRKSSQSRRRSASKVVTGLRRSASKVVTGLRRANFALFNHPQLSTVTTCLKPLAAQNSPTRLSCRWSRLVRQLSDTPPRARSTDKFPSIRMKMFPRTHVPRARNLPLDEIAHSAKLQVEASCTTTL